MHADVSIFVSSAQPAVNRIKETWRKQNKQGSFSKELNFPFGKYIHILLKLLIKEICPFLWVIPVSLSEMCKYKLKQNIAFL